ncbi:hypothetical protein ACVWZ4_007165 [Bradyrhizobium sp. USDA 4472]
MEYLGEHSARVFRQPEPTNEQDRITHHRWTRAVLAFYGGLVLIGATIIGVQSHSSTPSIALEQHAKLNR